MRIRICWYSIFTNEDAREMVFRARAGVIDREGDGAFFFCIHLYREAYPKSIYYRIFIWWSSHMDGTRNYGNA